MPDHSIVYRSLTEIVQDCAKAGAPEQAQEAVSEVVLPRVRNILLWFRQILPPRFFASPSSFPASGSDRIDSGLIDFQTYDFRAVPAPTFLPALSEVFRVPGETVYVQPKWPGRTVAGSNGVVDQLKICSARFAESLALQ